MYLQFLENGYLFLKGEEMKMVPVNTFVWGFHNWLVKIIDILKDQNTIVPKCWLGRLREFQKDYKILEEKCMFHDGVFHTLKWTWVYRNAAAKYTHSVEFNQEVYDRVYEKMWLFIDQYSRNDMKWQQRSTHYYLNQFNLLYHFFYAIFIQEQIQLVLFSNLPHNGYEMIIYEIAKALGIRTILFTQSSTPNKFFGSSLFAG
jgi:hypothetical protein